MELHLFFIDYISFHSNRKHLIWTIFFIVLIRIFLIFSIEKRFSAHFEHFGRNFPFDLSISFFFQFLVNPDFRNITIFLPKQKSITKCHWNFQYCWTKANDSIAKEFFFSKWNRFYSFIRSLFIHSTSRQLFWVQKHNNAFMVYCCVSIKCTHLEYLHNDVYIYCLTNMCTQLWIKYVSKSLHSTLHTLHPIQYEVEMLDIVHF